MASLDRQAALDLMCQYTQSDSLRRHMLAVETAMRAYAAQFGEDSNLWGIVGLLHDFDYEQNPEIPDHPLKGAEILAERGYPDQVIYAIKSHVDQLPGHPRISQLDKTLFACDELCGFLTACAYVRPEGIHGMKPKSVRKKMKQKSFAAAVNRDDITSGAEELGVDLNEHIQFVIEALQANSAALKLDGQPSASQT